MLLMLWCISPFRRPIGHTTMLYVCTLNSEMDLLTVSTYVTIVYCVLRLYEWYRTMCCVCVCVCRRSTLRKWPQKISKINHIFPGTFCVAHFGVVVHSVKLCVLYVPVSCFVSCAWARIYFEWLCYTVLQKLIIGLRVFRFRNDLIILWLYYCTLCFFIVLLHPFLSCCATLSSSISLSLTHFLSPFFVPVGIRFLGHINCVL